MINRVVLVGRLTRDVEVKKSGSGLSVANFTLACDRRVAKTEGNQQTADFINCVAWRQSADYLGQYARKGSIVGVDGRLQTRDYERDGRRVYVTEVICDTVRLLESRATTESRMQNTSSSGYYEDNSYSSDASYDVDNDYDGASLDISSEDLPF